MTSRKAKQPTEDDTPSDAEVVPLTESRPISTSDRFKGVGTAVVAGATGQTGKAIVQRLIRDGVPVRALVRDLSKAVSFDCSARVALPGKQALSHWVLEDRLRGSVPPELMVKWTACKYQP